MSEKRNLVPTWKVKVDENDVDNATFKGTLRRVTVNDPINAVGMFLKKTKPTLNTSCQRHRNSE